MLAEHKQQGTAASEQLSACDEHWLLPTSSDKPSDSWLQELLGQQQLVQQMSQHQQMALDQQLSQVSREQQVQTEAEVPPLVLLYALLLCQSIAE